LLSDLKQNLSQFKRANVSTMSEIEPNTERERDRDERKEAISIDFFFFEQQQQKCH